MRRDKYILIGIFFIALIVLLPSYDKYWAPYDEGNYTITPLMILNGMVPYRDFLLAMYTPGYAYVLAALFKIFGINLLVSRIYNIILLSIISSSVFYITKKVSGSIKYGLVAFIACLSILAGWGEPPIPRPIWPGVTLSMLGVLSFIIFIDKEKLKFLILSSFFIALTTMFRHDIGFLTFLAVLIGILFYSAYCFQDNERRLSAVLKYAFKLSFIYSVLPFIFVMAFVICLYSVNALEGAKAALVTLPSTFGEWARIPFPKFCFDFSMIFHRGCLFIKNNKFYMPIILCAISLILFTAELLTKKRIDKRMIHLSVLISLAVFYLEQLVFRTDTNHLAVSFLPAAILFALTFTYGRDVKWKFFGAFKTFLIAYATLLMALLFYHAGEKYIKDIVIKPYIKKEIELVSFRRGAIYIPDDVRDTFVYLVKYTDDNARPGEKIYVGHLRHNVPQMGWFDLIYFLTDTLPGVKHYVMIPGFQTRADIQREMAHALEENNVKIVLLRDWGKSGTLGPLDEYIRENYKLDKVINDYNIYVRR